MKKQSGFTVIELMIVLAIIGILVSLFVGGCTNARHVRSNGDGTYCLGGYKWMQDVNGTAHQVFGPSGPEKCSQQ